MKQVFKFITAISVFAILSVGAVVAEETTKEFHESWTASSVETLEVINKFGEVKINNEGGSEITIDVIVTVEAPNEKRANELLAQINVKMGKSGSTVKAETIIESSFKSQKHFSIDYSINIPSDKKLKITNKYGDTFVNQLNASGDFNSQYGNLSANQLNAPENGHMNIYLAYGKANIESSSDVAVNVKYSTMNFGEIDDLKLESKYSVINIEEASELKIESKYDTFSFEEVESVLATSKYSKIKIEELAGSLKIEAGYGGVKVEEVKPGFESISITNSYGKISLGLDEANYSVDASCEYCGISYPEDVFVGEKLNEKNTRVLKGKFGEGDGGTVYIKSRYGDIRLND